MENNLCLCSRCFCPDSREREWTMNVWKTYAGGVFITAVLWAVEQTGCGQIKCLWILSMPLSCSVFQLYEFKWPWNGRDCRWFIHYIKTCSSSLRPLQREGGKSGQVTKKKMKGSEWKQWVMRQKQNYTFAFFVMLFCVSISLPRNNTNVTSYHINISTYGALNLINQLHNTKVLW